MPNLTREIEIVSKLARKAGEVIMNIYQKDFTVMYKGINDPVTQADQQANALIVDELHTRFPHDSIVAEESPFPSNSLTTGRVWYVDPLDGTKEFIARNGEFSIMIGLTIDARSKLGVVYWPARDHLYAGLTDKEAWIECNGLSQKLSALESKCPPNISLVTSRSHRSPILSTIQQS
ncbi:MAG: 3'(2'),5'-bisphosphate nucleotidase CysQ, partial [Nitrospira sp.]|nr:3'(2'),5'-bisphosphate nucleotidase CysQ [Nitrospira sp.]